MRMRLLVVIVGLLGSQGVGPVLRADEPINLVAPEEAPAWKLVAVGPAEPAAVAAEAPAEVAIKEPEPQAAAEEEAIPVEVFIDVAVPAIQLEAAAGGELDEDAQLAPLRAQYGPLLKAELSFANRVCEFSNEQRRQAIAAGVKWLTEFARAQLVGNQIQRGGLFAFFGAQPQRPADPVVTAESQIADIVRSVLTDEQKQQYESQLAQRSSFQRQAVIDNVIAKMDEHMDLSVEQRAKLTKTLLARWDENWAPPLDSFVHMGEYMPSIPDEYVAPHLSDEQKQIWNGLQKISFGRENFENMDVFGGVGLDDIDLTDVDTDATE